MTENTASTESPTQNEPAANDAVHVQMVLDRSGGMGPIKLATVGAINGFLAKQRKQPGMLRITLADFDRQGPFRIVTDAIPIAEMVDLTPASSIAVAPDEVLRNSIGGRVLGLPREPDENERRSTPWNELRL